MPTSDGRPGKTRRHIYSVEMRATTADSLRAYAKAHGLSQRRLVSNVLTWFIARPPEEQHRILDEAWAGEEHRSR